MLIEFDHRESNSPFVERIWRSRSRLGGRFLSMADSNIELVFTRLPHLVAATLRGPVSTASYVDCPPDGEWLAIRFRVGTYVPGFPTAALADHRNAQLPILPDGRFWLCGQAWKIPHFDSAEDFVKRLALAGVIARSDAASAILEGDPVRASQRSLQRHFHQAIGLTLGGHRQIQRARSAAALLMAGAPLLDATFDAGYFDQPHLTRSLKRLIGMTPARLVRERPQLRSRTKQPARDPLSGASGTAPENGQ